MGLPNRCPACTEPLRVDTLRCPSCRTTVQGEFQLCLMCRLEEDDRVLLDLFLRARGNLKDVQRALGVSYPTVRSRMERLWVAAGYGTDRAPSSGPSAEIDRVIASVRQGTLTVEEAETRLRRLTGTT